MIYLPKQTREQIVETLIDIALFDYIENRNITELSKKVHEVVQTTNEVGIQNLFQHLTKTITDRKQYFPNGLLRERNNMRQWSRQIDYLETIFFPLFGYLGGSKYKDIIAPEKVTELISHMKTEAKKSLEYYHKLGLKDTDMTTYLESILISFA